MKFVRFGGRQGTFFSKEILNFLFVIPLFLSICSRSFMAHDEGYYILQSRAIVDSGNWLAPTSWGIPVFDRSIGVQWIIAGCQKVFGYTSWSSHIPSLVFALVSLFSTYFLAKRFFGKQLAMTSTGILLLSPIFLDYTHLATQDMPLLAIELVGIYSLVNVEKEKVNLYYLFSGMWMGIGFLVKGFMIFLPILAIIPFIFWTKRYLLSSKLFLAGFIIGWIPVTIWIALSVHEYGFEVISELLGKLIYLSGDSTFSEGPFYYLWNIPLFTIPWCFFSINSLSYGIRNWRDERLFVFVVYPLVLTFLLSCFKTKTTYYGLQLTPFISILAAYSVVLLNANRVLRKRIIVLIKGFGLCLIVASIVLALGYINGAFIIDAYTFSVIMLVSLIMSSTWISLSKSDSGRRIFVKLMLCQWAVMVILTQGGFLTDRNPAIRSALSDNYSVMTMIGDQRVSFVEASEKLAANDSKKRILIALAMKKLNHSLISNDNMTEGDLAWIHERDIHLLPPGGLSILYSNNDLLPWVLVAKN